MIITETSLLDILERERQGLRDEKVCGDLLMQQRAKETPNEELCDYFISKRDEAVRMINEARYDLKMYCEYFGLGR